MVTERDRFRSGLPEGLGFTWPGQHEGAATDAQLAALSQGFEVIEAHGEAEPVLADNRLIWGDNLRVLDGWLSAAVGTVNLVYLDPPFNTGKGFPAQRDVGQQGRREAIRVPGYDDQWAGGAAGFIAMLAPRLERLYQLLAPDGSLYLHVDPKYGHYVKLLLDEIFGYASYQREIVWRIGWLSGFKTSAKNWIRNHDSIFYYVKDPDNFTFNKQYLPYPEGYRRRDGKLPTGRGVPLEDVWNANAAEAALSGRASLDSIQIKSFSREKTGWATQKNESLLERIIAASSNPGDLVVDPFAGSGTTAVVAETLGRRWWTIDRSSLAVEMTRERLLDRPGVQFQMLKLNDRWCAARSTARPPGLHPTGSTILRSWCEASGDSETKWPQEAEFVDSPMPGHASVQIFRHGARAWMIADRAPSTAALGAWFAANAAAGVERLHLAASHWSHVEDAHAFDQRICMWQLPARVAPSVGGSSGSVALLSFVERPRVRVGFQLDHSPRFQLLDCRWTAAPESVRSEPRLCEAPDLRLQGWSITYALPGKPPRVLHTWRRGASDAPAFAAEVRLPALGEGCWRLCIFDLLGGHTVHAIPVSPINSP